MTHDPTNDWYQPGEPAIGFVPGARVAPVVEVAPLIPSVPPSGSDQPIADIPTTMSPLVVPPGPVVDENPPAPTPTPEPTPPPPTALPQVVPAARPPREILRHESIETSATVRSTQRPTRPTGSHERPLGWSSASGSPTVTVSVVRLAAAGASFAIFLAMIVAMGPFASSDSAPRPELLPLVESSTIEEPASSTTVHDHSLHGGEEYETDSEGDG